MPTRSETRRETRRLIDQGFITPRTKCDICQVGSIEVNHLDYDDPTKVNYLCHKHHYLYHSIRKDAFFHRYVRIPRWVYKVFTVWSVLKSILLYYVILRLYYLPRRFFPSLIPVFKPDRNEHPVWSVGRTILAPGEKVKMNPIWDTVAKLQAEKAKKQE